MYQMVKMTMYTNTVARWMRKYSGALLNISSQNSIRSPNSSQKALGDWGMPDTLPPLGAEVPETRNWSPHYHSSLSHPKATVHFPNPTGSHHVGLKLRVNSELTDHSDPQVR